LLVRGGHGFTKQLDVFTKVEDATHFNLDFVSERIPLIEEEEKKILINGVYRSSISRSRLSV
jgi:hypothetical protein